MTRPLPFHALLIVVLLVGCSPTAPPQDAAVSKRQAAGQSHPEVARSVAEQVTTLSVVGEADQPAPTPSMPASPVLALAEPSARLPAARQAAQDSTALAPARMSSRRDTDELRAPSEPTDRENYAQVED
ncbi:MAG TPA: hypothetical protein PKD21_01780, partial [Candidatus Competibacter phosphatis]|nr:hypothetical protein [Candidatus Competibacter phosphatis]